MKAGLSATLAAHVAETRFERLPAAAVTAARRSLLDALGVMYAASALGEGVDAFAALARRAGPGRCALLGRGERAALLPATLSNGALTHALDYEDAYDGAPVHPNAAAVPAVLALAQDRGGADGRTLLTALAVGCDLVCRLGVALTENPDDRGWYPPPILGAQGAAAACAVLLGLEAQEVEQAFALALGPAAQSSAFKTTGDSHLRAVRDAFAAQAGLQAALLAADGVRAFDQPLEGPAGFFALYAGGAYSADAALTDLGRRFLGADVSFKPWPSCRGTHAAIEAALDLRGQAPAAAVRAVRITGGPVQRMLAEPPARKQAPTTAIDAKFSLPFTFATAFAHGAVTLESFAPAALRDPAVLALAARVAFQVDPALGMADATSATVTVELADGRVLERRIDQPLGHPTRPLEPAALLAKFHDCVARAVRPPADPARLAETILRLDEIENLDAAFFGLL